MVSLSSAQEKYTEALELAPSTAKERAVYHSNRAACLLRLNRHAETVTDCTQALEQDPSYCKALMRRAAAYESLDDLEHALLDLQQVCRLLAGLLIGKGMVTLCCNFAASYLSLPHRLSLMNHKYRH